MSMWHEVYGLIKPLRSSCARAKTFVWLVVAVTGFCTAPDLMGVTSFVRSAYLTEKCYVCLLHFFNAGAVCLTKLTALWMGIVKARFEPVTIGAKYILFVADGINVPKEGRKMPSVQSLHNASDNNSKPKFIMGHHFESIAMLCRVSATGVVAVPLISRITGGMVTSNRCTKTLLDRFVSLFNEQVAPSFEKPKLIVADAYYATAKAIVGLRQSRTELISRVKSNCVAYAEPPKPKKGKRGRPKKYGKKMRLNACFQNTQSFFTLPSPVYGEENVTLKVREANLLWRPVGWLVKFVWVIHPTRGEIILMSTDTNLSATDIIYTYGLRFKIEVGFKVALRSIGVYAYRFWSKTMHAIVRRSKGQWLHHETEEYRTKMMRKLRAYHLFVQVGCVAQGALQFLCVYHQAQVWASFRGFMRTIRRDIAPSERVAALALQSSLPEFLTDRQSSPELAKMVGPKLDFKRVPGIHLAA